MIDGLLVFVGIFLLYFPPLFTAIFQGILKRYSVLIDYIYNVLIGFILFGLLSLLIPQAAYVFLFYFMLFFLTRVFIRSASRCSISNLDAFSLAVYICFSVAVLWEIPIQLTIYQNIDAVLLSGFKALAIPLFIHKINKLGYKFKVIQLYILIGIFIYAVFLISGIRELGINIMFYQAHVMRIPIIFFLYSLIPLNHMANNDDKHLPGTPEIVKTVGPK